MGRAFSSNWKILCSKLGDVEHPLWEWAAHIPPTTPTSLRLRRSQLLPLQQASGLGGPYSNDIEAIWGLVSTILVLGIKSTALLIINFLSLCQNRFTLCLFGFDTLISENSYCLWSSKWKSIRSNCSSQSVTSNSVAKPILQLLVYQFHTPTK